MVSLDRLLIKLSYYLNRNDKNKTWTTLNFQLDWAVAPIVAAAFPW